MVKNYLTKPFFLACLICIVVFYSGIIKISNRFKLKSLLPESEISSLSGYLISTPVKSSSGKTYSAKLKVSLVENKNGAKCTSNSCVNVFIPSSLVEVYFPGKLYTASNKGSFLYEAGGFYSFSGKFVNQGFLVDSCNYSFWKNNFTGKIDYFRALCRLQFKRIMYSWKEGGELLLALLSGAKEYTEDATKESFKNAGLSHILALSGMHLSMFSSIAVFFGEKLKNKKLTYLLKIIMLLIFVWFAGFSPSLLRAFICSMLFIIASMSSSAKPDMILILCFSFLIQLIISPSDLLNTGFLLSYGALAGILLTGNFFRQFTDIFLPKHISTSFSSSLGAQVITAPISLNFFGAFSPIGIIATTIVSPLITVFIYSGLILIIVTLMFPGFSTYSGIFVNFLYTVIKTIVNYFSHFPRVTI